MSFLQQYTFHRTNGENFVVYAHDIKGAYESFRHVFPKEKVDYPEVSRQYDPLKAQRSSGTIIKVGRR